MRRLVLSPLGVGFAALLWGQQVPPSIVAEGVPEVPAELVRTSARLVYEARGLWFPTDWSPDHNSLLIVKYVSINETYPHILEIATGKAEPLFPMSQEQVAYFGGTFARDGKGVYLVTATPSSSASATWISPQGNSLR